MLVARVQPCVDTIGTTIIAAGGFANTNQSVTDNEAYDPVADAWSARAPMPTPRQAGCAGAIKGALYAAGGAQSTKPLTRLDGYKNTTDKWSPLLAIPKGSDFTGLGRRQHLLYCFGGANKGFDRNQYGVL